MNKYCIDCIKLGIKKLITPKATRCRSCSSKNNRKKKFWATLPKGTKFTEKHKNNMRKSFKEKRFGVNNANYGKKHPGLNKGHTNPMYGKSGELNPMFGKPTKSTYGIYKNIKMRSSWEINYAKWLDQNNIKWLYEYMTFNLKDTTYTPDFYLLDTDEYIEIKGYWRKGAKEKFHKFLKLYPNIKISVIEEQEYKKIVDKINSKEN